MTDEQARASIAEVLLRAFAARDDAPVEMRDLLARLDGVSPSPPSPSRPRRPRKRN